MKKILCVCLSVMAFSAVAHAEESKEAHPFKKIVVEARGDMKAALDSALSSFKNASEARPAFWIPSENTVVVAKPMDCGPGGIYCMGGGSWG